MQLTSHTHDAAWESFLLSFLPGFKPWKGLLTASVGGMKLKARWQLSWRKAPWKIKLL